MVTEQARGAPLKPLEDTTPLNGAAVDVPVRVGWLLRMARLTAGDGSASRLSDMVERLGVEGLATSSSSLHRLETGVVRDGGLVDAYERVLRLPPASLRSAIDVMCRTFAYAPADRDPGDPVTTVEEMQRLHAPVLAGTADGAEWLAWARALALPGNIGLPRDLALELVGRLLSEAGRAVGRGYAARYDALTLLRRSAYGGIVLEAVRRMIADPHVQVVNDPLSIVGQAVDPQAAAWALDLLDDQRPWVVQGACLTLETMAEVSGDRGFWTPHVERLAKAYNEARPGTGPWRWLSHLLRLLPSADLQRIRGRLAHAPSPTVSTPDPGNRSGNLAWNACEHQSHVVCDRLTLPPQPLLTRLIWEIIAGGPESRALTAAFLCTSIEPLRAAVADAVAEIAVTSPDPAVRERAGRRLVGLVDVRVPTALAAWRDDQGDRHRLGLLVSGIVGDHIPDDVLLAAVETPASARAATYAAGMADHPLLHTLARSQDPDVAGAARWWLGQGARVRDV
ncbi:hypothetical protein [Nocardioides sp. GY 10127]|uniref:hypothetical protein n=1 Tax=Nocardioides sp. GY 10127 TaxID=2569762 RepID=UPI0010A8DB9D|nr:hypothetical protein [Nocardioides sp. GY 10127]TIC82596.1 hypothetical protein E8D37_07725 [Nocardioides sp. GY 10127]